MRTSSKALAGLTALALMGFAATAQANGPNLVTNPGFETGDFTGYTVTGTDTSVDFSVGHTGDYAASFGAISPNVDTLSQTLNTVTGMQYDLTFFAQTPEFGVGTGQPNTLTVLFGGVPVTPTFDVPDDPSYQQYSYLVTATSNSSTLEFDLSENETNFTQLDDISVTAASASPAPEPAMLAPLGFMAAGLAGAVLLRRKKAQTAV